MAHGSSTDRRIVRWVQLRDGHPSSGHITYAPEDPPITGMVQGNSTADLEAFLNKLFKTVRICTAPQST